ncbi:MAG: 30S ribosomal protein S18 [Spirochaetae bacterium HGW-Spirochaetae-4]|jgi:small subunit ribosomal protein S18|nr:30S ribosomal protein S18 [Sphaerochaeta sp.]OHD31008.1 MAG: 30S ribosomal protein S18 [Spirochaetes bacterium GWC2_52_13]OHD66818.1 MAG: 30S ribosomal protein S18 [Spirochaetes bacterium GWF2_52_7]PKL21325.1 MAG: 30S ribosomal protein S18 [Spirochaetae bacterium HGW-Spirochaetae-4]PKL29639.1 MAG: 30S ribosomal protein S18 [Spirochaetae bacterium HGW-Spirochaetae-2]
MRDDKDSMNNNDSNDSRGGNFRDRRFGGGKRGPFKKKVCKFCTQNLVADYKNPDLLRRYVTERGKILPSRITGNCAKHQRALTTEIKRARVLAYLPFDRK